MKIKPITLEMARKALGRGRKPLEKEEFIKAAICDMKEAMSIARQAGMAERSGLG